MLASVRAFLHEIIDYAGLFPPARQPLDVALAEYLHHKKKSPHRWMLGKFVCPAARLAELLPLARAHEDAGLLSLTVLGQQGVDVGEFVAKMDADIAAIEGFRSDWGNAAVIDSIEIPLPKEGIIEAQPTATEREASAFPYGGAIAGNSDSVAGRLKKANLRGYLEVPMSPRWPNNLDTIAWGLCSACDDHGEPAMGLKLRCGGVTADAFPSEAQVAFFIKACLRTLRPWKATAGLHHPRRHWDAGLQLWHHGFLNVFGAGLLADLAEEDCVAVLSDREGRDFHFDERGFSWKEWSCTVAEIAEFRASGPTSFGSCSFSEPCADLTALGLLTD